MKVKKWHTWGLSQNRGRLAGVAFGQAGWGRG
jgi:hypothetical protein